uniref:Protein translocase subunit SecY n=1 Tax=Lygus hesperus TaxID=30085 RepID=A0A0A9XAM5_LYGHE
MDPNYDRCKKLIFGHGKKAPAHYQEIMDIIIVQNMIQKSKVVGSSVHFTWERSCLGLFPPLQPSTLLFIPALVLALVPAVCDWSYRNCFHGYFGETSMV